MWGPGCVRGRRWAVPLLSSLASPSFRTRGSGLARFVLKVSLAWRHGAGCFCSVLQFPKCRGALAASSCTGKRLARMTAKQSLLFGWLNWM